MSESRTDPLNGWQGWERVPADCLPVAFSAHAFERFAERLRSGELDPEAVAHELARMMPAAIVTSRRPEWMNEGEARYYLLLGEDVALPLIPHGEELRATTVVVKGMLGDKRRETRNAAKRWRRDGRARGRVAQKMDGGRPRSGPTATEWDGEA